MKGSSHVVFGLAGAVVVDSFFHVSGDLLFTPHAHPTAGLIFQKVIYYGFAALGALTPDIDNARSTLGKRLGPISKEIQHLAGHRTFFHSVIGLVFSALVVLLAQFGLGWVFTHFGYIEVAHLLNFDVPIAQWPVTGVGIAFEGLFIGYFLHLVADSLTIGGVPWLFPSRVRYGFPPVRSWRFKTGTPTEYVVVALTCVLVAAGVYFQKLFV